MNHNDSIGGKISVCLITYNHVNVIESTIRSILDQTVTNCEIVISDDCSSDGTWERILPLAPSGGNIPCAATPRNLGMAGNANFAVSQTTREYVALLHHDDLYRPDLLEKWAGVLERYPDVDFVFNQYNSDEKHIDVQTLPRGGEKWEGTDFLEHDLFPRWGCSVRGTAMIRRTAWHRAGGMREEFGLLADVDLWMRLSRTGAVGYVPEPLITVRHARPAYYPDLYQSGWSWPRQILLYEIHGRNRIEYLRRGTITGRITWWWFRLRLSMETTKWLVYALVKGKDKHYIIASSDQSRTRYDLPGLELLRRLLRFFVSATGGHR